MHGPKKKLIVILKYHMDTIYWCKITNESIYGGCMENWIAKLDADTMAIILAVAYGVLSDVIGESKKTRAGSIPGFLLVVLKALAKNIPQAKGKKK